MKRWLLLLLCASLAACASPGSFSGEDPTIADLELQQATLAQELETRIEMANRCEDLCLHVGKICELTDRICRIARRHSTGDAATRSCTRATRVCEQSRARLPEDCGCKPAPETNLQGTASSP